MKATPASAVLVAHVLTWSDRTETHESAVNDRLANLTNTAIVLGVDHAANLVDTPDGLAHQFSTLITYRRYFDPNAS